MGLAYGLMGWYCASFDAILNIGSWLIAMALTFFLIWGWSLVVRVVLLTPRILVLLLVLSMALTIAVSFSNLFILMIILLASTLFSKLELQTAGVDRIWALIIISIVSGAMIGAGWAIGHHFYPNPTKATQVPVTKKLPNLESFR